MFFMPSFHKGHTKSKNKDKNKYSRNVYWLLSIPKVNVLILFAISLQTGVS